jgi:transcriptional regulator with XRE-family HTH domain
MLKQERRKYLQFIEALMRDRQYSQNELARQSGYSKSRLSDIMKNKSGPNALEQYIRLFNALRYRPIAGFIAANAERYDFAHNPLFSCVAELIWWRFYQQTNIEFEEPRAKIACETLCAEFTVLHRRTPDSRDWSKADIENIVTAMSTSAHRAQFDDHNRYLAA